MEKFDTSELMERLFAMSGAKYIDKYCDEHNKQWIQFKDGRANCPRCFCQNGNQTFTVDLNKEIQEREIENVLRHIERYSIFPNTKLLDCSLEGFKQSCTETESAFKKANECVRLYKFGNNFNCVLTGPSGTGKSHLAYSIAKAVSEKRRCLFISVPKMVSLIQDSFRNKESKYTQEYFFKIMNDSDVLVIDDLGAEVGRIDTDKVASDFITKLLFNVYESRQGKSTITTTNLRGARVKEVYDDRMITRLNADVQKWSVIKFENAKNMR